MPVAEPRGASAARRSLPADDYADEHLAGAINIPLNTLDRDSDRFSEAPATGDRLLLRLPVRPEPASRVAARRIEFTRAYDCVAGKADWGSFGLPLEGEADSRTRIGSIAGGDTPTWRPDEFFSAVAQRVADESQICVVTNEKRIIMGILGRRALRSCFPFPRKRRCPLDRARSGRVPA